MHHSIDGPTTEPLWLMVPMDPAIMDELSSVVLVTKNGDVFKTDIEPS
jgi:hypothetical protein